MSDCTKNDISKEEACEIFNRILSSISEEEKNTEKLIVMLIRSGDFANLDIPYYKACLQCLCSMKNEILEIGKKEYDLYGFEDQE